jgi:hypothetical protein
MLRLTSAAINALSQGQMLLTQAVVVILALTAISRTLLFLDGTLRAVLSQDALEEKLAARYLPWKIGIIFACLIAVTILIIR